MAIEISVAASSRIPLDFSDSKNRLKVSVKTVVLPIIAHSSLIKKHAGRSAAGPESGRGRPARLMIES